LLAEVFVALLNRDEKSRIIEKLGEFIPHANLLGIRLESIKGDALTLRLPYQASLVGNPETGALHGGAVTVLLDQTMGLSAVCSDSMQPSITPTLDLRIDHLHSAPPGHDLLATARVYHASRRIVFVEGIAWYESPQEPVARAMGSWVRIAEVDLTRMLDPRQGEAQQ
jgi:uncharacterized protein (TIGR00369 family)